MNLFGTKQSKEELKQKLMQNKAASTQRYLQFAGARDNTLILKDGGLRAVLEVSSINFNLKSEEEQNAIIGSYQQFLNALTFPVQLLVRSRKLDIDTYLADMRGRMKNIENQLLKDQMAEYIEYVQKLVEYSDIMEKRFFVVVPIDPPRAQKKTLIGKFMSYINPDDTVMNILKRRGEFKQLKKQLDERLEVALTAIGNCGLKVEPLKTEEIIELFYQVYNPQLARNQKLGDLEEIAITQGPEENLVEEQ
jgi:type IV secretory pathway VirB4 component